MKKYVIALLVATSLFIAFDRVNAIPLIERDLINNSGDGLITYDPITGLEWLDLTASINRSYSDVSTQFGAGGDFEGFRYASNSEIQTLFANSGISNDFNTSNYSPANELISLISSTASNNIQTWAKGLSADRYYAPNSSTYYWTPTIEIRDIYSTANASMNGYASIGYWSPSIGSWLVRTTPLPEPSTIFLFIGGLFIQVVIRRNITRRSTWTRSR